MEHSREVTTVASRVLELMVDRETGLRGYLLTHDAASLQPDVEARSQLPRTMDALIRITADNPAQTRRAREIARAVARWDTTFAAPVLAGTLSVRGNGLAGKSEFDEVRRTIREFSAQEAAIFAERRRSDARMRSAAAIAFIVETIVFAALFSLAYSRVRRQSLDLSTQHEQLTEQAFELECQAVEAEAQTAALAVSEERYRTLFGSLPFGVVLQADDASFQFGNAAAAQMLGVTVEELDNRASETRSWGVIRRDGSAFPSAQLPGLRSLRSGNREIDVVGLVRSDDSLVWTNVTAQPASYLMHAGSAGVLISFVDITAQLVAEESLRSSSALVEAIVRASPVAIIALDTELRVTSWNAGAERLFGWTSAEVLGQRYPIIPEEQWEEYLELHARLLEQGQSPDQRRVRKHKDGSLVTVSVSSSILRDKDGAVIGAVMMALDLTEREVLEANLRQAHKMEAIGQLAGGVAHDFNNLLTVILSYSELHLEEPHGDAALTKDLRAIRDAAMRAAELTRQLLTFSRRQVLSVNELSLNQVLEGISPMLSRLLGSSIQLSEELERDLWPCRADRGQIEQVIMNLAVNARDAMPDGGALTISTTNVIVAAERDARFEGMSPGRYVTLCVRDHGIGMDTDTRGHVFEPFFTTKSPGEGTGLGLATVYGIVKQSHGFIHIESEVGRGSEFRVTLPVSVPAMLTARQDHLEGAPAKEDEAPITILVVEDVDAIRKLSRSILERQGHTILEASNGVVALSMLADAGGAVDLVLSDIQMPTMGGLELMSRLGELYPRIPIMLVSAYTEGLLVQRGMLSRRVGFLEKPFTPATLRQALTDFQRSHREGSWPTTADLAARPLVAIVDDTELNRVLVAAILEDTCAIMSHAGGLTTIRDLVERLPAAILLDIDMPELDGFQILRGIREEPALQHINVIAFSARVRDADRRMFEAAGFDDIIAKPIADFDAFRAQVANSLKSNSGERRVVSARSEPRHSTSDVV
ncbi:MAG TPA: response regulator [Gemmatimonadaceae bacterium]|nr:response regulator [Gemmatimonadaceae bacterium]